MNVSELVLQEKKGIVAKVSYTEDKVLGVKYEYPTKETGKKVVDLTDAEASENVRKSFSKMVESIVSKKENEYSAAQIAVMQDAKLQFGL